MKLTSMFYEGFANVSLRVETHESQMKARAPAASRTSGWPRPQKEHVSSLRPRFCRQSEGIEQPAIRVGCASNALCPTVRSD
jgi:hypothetical protein